jgi:flagellar biogenesis protein FliO
VIVGSGLFTLPVLLALAQTTPDPLPGGLSGGEVTRGLLAVFVVFGLLALLAWAGKRGLLGGLPRQGKSGVKIETAVPLGERRSLMIVSIEGRRLLIGLTPMQVSLVTELSAARESFDDTLARSVSSPSSPASPATP